MDINTESAYLLSHYMSWFSKPDTRKILLHMYGDTGRRWGGSELAKEVGLKQQNVSYHLRNMRQVGLVEQIGTRQYVMNFEKVSKILQIIINWEE